APPTVIFTLSLHDALPIYLWWIRIPLLLFIHSSICRSKVRNVTLCGCPCTPEKHYVFAPLYNLFQSIYTHTTIISLYKCIEIKAFLIKSLELKPKLDKNLFLAVSYLEFLSYFALKGELDLSNIT